MAFGGRAAAGRLTAGAAWRRAAAVFALAVRMGFAFWRGARQARRLPPEERRAHWDAVCRQEGRRLRRAAEELRGLIIKVGQFLSTRVDVLPSAFTRELAELQDLVPPEPWPAVRARLEAAYGGWPAPGLAEVAPEPVAAASLAQVHRGRAADGSPVAVKIWRPGIEALVEADLSTLGTVARFIARHTAWGRRFDLMAVFREFEETTREELDSAREAARADEFRRNLRGSPEVGAPRVYAALTRPGVLVMEFIEGVRFDDPDVPRFAGVSGRELSARLLRAFLRQVLQDGLFHADPHAGNLLVQADGRLVFVDFGMMGRLSEADRRAMARLLRDLIAEDWDGVVRECARLGFLRPEAELARVRERLPGLLQPLLQAAGQAGAGDMPRVLREAAAALQELPVQFPARFTFLGRALGMVMGLVVRVHPEEPFERQFRRALEDVLLGREGRRRLTANGSESPAAALAARLLRGTARLLRLPGRVERVLERLQSGEAARPQEEALARSFREVRDAAERAGWLLFAALAWLAGAVDHALGRGSLPMWLSWAAAAAGLAMAWRAGRRG
ncbi:MAG: AarF/ABC1/UbiB kinase family protein [Firmicutes bacterium]|nr:AarF/ABC1/UbiB kinase family protein [Bacillota bacterium]